ncbi:hypothetical protein AVEN_147893-1 [Araneus ventricosus]|uniref:Uncharacterized protein n=1 Tax=Araneus ventricosus TaxID=182803 RepID=A0A4Y2VCW8_ARAVE|nr:hypothetical protein AVEN_147893-1 [Araneus ventricosus]
MVYPWMVNKAATGSSRGLAAESQLRGFLIFGTAYAYTIRGSCSRKMKSHQINLVTGGSKVPDPISRNDRCVYGTDAR